MDKVKRTLRDLKMNDIKVGVFGSDDSDMVMIAGVHEYGTDITVTPKMRAWFAANGFPLKKETTTITIPERSFIRSGFDENIDEIFNKMKQLLPQVLEQEVDTRIFMDMIGLEFAGMIQKKLRDLRDPENSDMTVQRKGSSNPLFDKGRLVGSIRHEVD
ncbi:hypothetical protein [Bacillus infantis]|uniref:hypothetical protein n=1 Tax=Bacillus infantis TaxID=324767 RepID=UPI00196B26E3|nr:hypothetical protein [Bacillus infantis]